MSSATIRNEMMTLEQLGLLAAPHTSAGRIPTEAGYRYFVSRLLDSNELTLEERQDIAEGFHEAPSDLAAWLKLAVSTLARTSRSAAIVTAPQAPISQYKHMALLAVQGRMVMMVLVLHGGYVRQHMLSLSETLPQDALSAIANRFNAVCEGKNADEIRSLLPNAERDLDREILDLVVRTLAEHDGTYAPNVYGDGLSELLPELTQGDAVKQALRIMEEQTPLLTIMADLAANAAPQVGGVHVLIAGEGRWQDVRHLSLILSRYGVDGGSTGALAVFGPTRMRYGRAISAVRYMASVMSNLLIEAYGSKPD